MAWDGIIAALLTIVPALMMLLWVLKRYEGFFDERKLFFALTVGLFGGLLVRFLQANLMYFESPLVQQRLGAYYSLGYTAVGYALLAALAMTAVMGFGRFRQAKDAAFHGTALGAAFGGMWMQPTTKLLLPLENGHLVTTTAGASVVLGDLVIGAGLILTLAAVGGWVGRGSAEGRLTNSVLYGMLWGVPAYAAYWFYYNAWEQSYGIDPRGPIAGNLPPLAWYAALATVAWGLFAVRRARRVLDEVVPPGMRAQIQREKRREARRKDDGDA
jgi:hypothetical protein